MIDGRLNLDVFDYGSTRAKIFLKFGRHEYKVENVYYFTSPKAAENQMKKLAQKLNINIIEIKRR